MTTSRSRTPKRRAETPSENEGFEIVEKPRQSPAEIDQDLHIPLTSRAVFWKPRHLALSDALLHVPYLFWLMETCRPANVVQLGTGDGVAFLAVCQAIDKLSLATPCVGLVPDTDTPALPESMATQHQSHYEDFSFMISEEPTTAVRHVRDRNIDLLILNAELTDERVMALRAHWQSRLSDQAVVVVLNPDRTVRNPSAREFIDALSRACPTVRLQHDESDIETYLVGKNQPERLKKLAALGIGEPAYLAARQVFSRLGQGLYQGQRARATQVDADTARESEAQTRAQLLQREDELKTLKRQHENTRQAEAEQAALANDLQARIFDAEEALKKEMALGEEKARTIAEIEQRHAELEQRCRAFEEKDGQREAEIKKLGTALEESQEKRTAFYAKLKELEAENASLTSTLEAKADEIAALSQTHAAMQEKLAKTESTLNERIDDIAVLTRDYEARLADSDAERAKLSAALTQADETHRETLDEKTALQEKLAKAESELETRVEDIVALSEGFEKRLAEESEHRAKAEAALEERIEDIAVLTRDYEKRLASSVIKQQKLDEDLTRRTEELVILTQKLMESESEREALLNSTSWRLTKPMRKAKLMIGG